MTDYFANLDNSRWDDVEGGVCHICYGVEYDHDEDCPLHFENMLDEEVDAFLEDDENE